MTMKITRRLSVVLAVGVAALSLTLSGCSSDSKALEVNTEQTFAEWAVENNQTYKDALNQAGEAVGRVSSGAGSSDFEDMSEGLSDLAAAGDLLYTILPTTDLELNKAILEFSKTMQSARDLAGFETQPSEAELDEILGLGEQVSEGLDAVLEALKSAKEAG